MSVLNYFKDRRIIILVVLVAALAVLDVAYGIHFGIEFVGGTQIPFTLEHPVNVTTMTNLVAALEQRVSTFGLKEINVEGVGDSHVYVTIPSVTPQEVNQTISIIESQGRFDGIVSGKEAINGTGILKGSIGALQPETINGSVSWAVTFYITQGAATRFGKVVFGQGNQPLYMFLDRPTDAAILINSSQISNIIVGLGPAKALAVMREALSDGNQTIPVYTVSGSNGSVSTTENVLLHGKSSKIITGTGLNRSLMAFMEAHNFTVQIESAQNMTPQIIQVGTNQRVVQQWPAVGLLSAPILNPSITNGSVGQSYEISGMAPQNGSLQQRVDYANLQSKTIASILNGGALPVAIIAGTPTTIPPTLGNKFLYVSGIAGIVAIAAVSLFMVIRYRKLFLVVPILVTTLMELFIVVSVIGLLGTIDLAAVAGMIAVVGTGIDAQIIITDELLGRSSETGSVKALLGNAFYIIWMDAVLLVIVMLPLFFSTSLVTVVGFSESTIIGALLGIFVTRPAYSAIVSKHYAHE